MSAFERLHPALQYHLVNTLGWSGLRPTQLAAIEPIQAGTHCLLLAPTAGGKTEAAAIPVLSRMLLEAWPATSVLYVCPIKALLNNLEPRLAHYAGLVGRRVQLWHGDIAASRKNRALKEPPDILLTTPESIEAMLVSPRVERAVWFANLKAVIVDELHAFAGDDRGWHLRALLHRLDRYLPAPLQRLGLSATVSNPEPLLAWLAPTGPRAVVGSASVSTDAEVTIDHVGSLENAGTVITRLHRGDKRLVFCDSRSVAERLSSQLRAAGVRTFLSHASLSVAERRQAEAAFAEERDCVIVATSTLELGIDVGDLDRVIQIDSPSSVSSFLQRMGRTGRRAGGRRNCLFLTTGENAFLLALGVTQKWAEAWVEAATAPGAPWHILAQQALALSLEYGELAGHDMQGLLQGAFPELDPGGIAELLEHLVSQQFLVSDEGVLRVGPQTERTYGRGHYRDLLASFSGSPLLTGRHGAAEVGYVDPSLLTGEREARLILLSGRSWHVTAVDWAKRIVWLEPAATGGKARWLGSGARVLSYEICQGIRTVLIQGASPALTLSRRARAELQSLAEDIPTPRDGHSTVSCTEGATARTWTFAGTRVNRTLAREASRGASRVRFDALSVQAPALGPLPRELNLLEEEVSAFAEAIKFAECLPRGLLERTVMERNFGVREGGGETSGTAAHHQSALG